MNAQITRNDPADALSMGQPIIEYGTRGMRQKCILAEIGALLRSPVIQEKRVTLGVFFCGAFLMNFMLTTNVAANTPHHNKKPKIEYPSVVSNATKKGDRAPLTISNIANKQDLSIRESVVRELP